MALDSRKRIEASLSRFIRDPFAKDLDENVFLEIKSLLARHPDKPDKPWRNAPRLYTLLRMLGYHDESPVFQKFEAERIGDFWLPLAPPTLAQLFAPDILDPDAWQHAELPVLSHPKMMSAEMLLSSAHIHRYIEDGSAYFENEGTIGM
jgi:hypothetical protein